MKQLENDSDDEFNPPEAPFQLWVTLDYFDGSIQLEWVGAETGIPEAELRVRLAGPEEISWEWEQSGQIAWRCRVHTQAIRRQLGQLRKLYPSGPYFFVGMIPVAGSGEKPKAGEYQALDVPLNRSEWRWLEQQILEMAMQLRPGLSPLCESDEDISALDDGYLQRLARKEQQARQAELERQVRIQAASRRIAEERRRKLAERRKREKSAAKSTAAASPPQPQLPPPPPVPVHVEFPPLPFQDSLLPLPDLRGFLLRERAAQWWISNQSDDLLALPYCKIERFDYQVRTALRVIGPLRGRALLSDEVGLGKTIEAGLVLKEYLTRGMVKRFLVLTVPSLVDQWEEELEDKFGIVCATTNQPGFRSDPAAFWRENPFVVASLHTVKQARHLQTARALHWDMLVVDEAHYLRNRSSQAWQAVNELPRQFLLLLTATPVQNSLEELYNLVTLLQPGQLPSPKEFRARFLEKSKPQQPREPEELRRLLSQVMIRNTRANAGLNLPPRRAETVLFTMDEVELAFEIRVIPHVDALLLLAEPAWKVSLLISGQGEQSRRDARWLPRTRRWLSAGEEG